MDSRIFTASPGLLNFWRLYGRLRLHQFKANIRRAGSGFDPYCSRPMLRLTRGPPMFHRLFFSPRASVCLTVVDSTSSPIERLFINFSIAMSWSWTSSDQNLSSHEMRRCLCVFEFGHTESSWEKIRHHFAGFRRRSDEFLLFWLGQWSLARRCCPTCWFDATPPVVRKCLSRRPLILLDATAIISPNPS